MAIKIAVATRKGGVGKSTTAINLADGLTRKGHKLLFVDTDPQCNSTRVFNAKTNGVATLADIMYGDEVSIRECIQQTDLVEIIASDIQLDDAENMVKVDADRFYHISDALKPIEDEYEYIVFDTPPGNGVMLGNVLSYADYVVIPVTADDFGVSGLSSFFSTINKYKERINKGIRIAGILLVMYKGRLSLTQDVEDNVLPLMAKELNTKIFDAKIRESVKCREAQTVKQSLFTYSPGSTTAYDYSAFVKELEHDIAKYEAQKKIGGV